MNWTETVERCKAGAFGPEVQALFLDPDPDLAVQFLVALILSKPAEERKWFFAQIKREQRMRSLSDGLQDAETAPA